jgi:hypothetical protein
LESPDMTFAVTPAKIFSWCRSASNQVFHSRRYKPVDNHRATFKGVFSLPN